MDTTVRKIHQSLQKLTGLHRQLLEVVRAEREALISAEIKRIEDALLLKQGLIEAIGRAEAERMGLAAELAAAWRKPLKSLTLPEIVIAVQGRDPALAEQLRSTYNVLTILVQRISESNQSNRELVEKSLEHVAEMKRNVLGEAAPRSGTYSPHGQKISGTAGARLISKEA